MNKMKMRLLLLLRNAQYFGQTPHAKSNTKTTCHWSASFFRVLKFEPLRFFLIFIDASVFMFFFLKYWERVPLEGDELIEYEMRKRKEKEEKLTLQREKEEKERRAKEITKMHDEEGPNIQRITHYFTFSFLL
jgi:hypothetical protein